MRIYIVIPCHNEADFIEQTLTSLVEQTTPAAQIVVVNDQSTDASAAIVTAFAKAHPYISLVTTTSSAAHLPGSKIIQAFQKGYETLDDAYDILCKFDADLIFPTNYLETLTTHFKTDS
ncbi:MAG: glycosyltransferase, partial [Dokdonia sp.]|nr:glycosyltransferase [Dokdonia sp.]